MHMRSVSFLRVAAVSFALAAPFATLAQATPIQPVDELLIQHQMGFSTGNDAAQGRYYDENDRYLDPHTGVDNADAPGFGNGGAQG
jgi:hypothetical protein